MLEFATREDAIEWMVREVDDPCVDNDRFAYLDDEAALAQYKSQEDDGCCGFFDLEILVAGRKATIGCNYGH